MQAYDLIMLIVLAMATIFGAIKGFAWQVASIASVIVSYFVAYRFRFELAERIQADPPWNLFLAMLILYVGTSFLIWVAFRLLSGTIDKVKLKEFDRHLGAAFGLVKGTVYCLLITMFAMSLLGPNQQRAICQSKSGYYIATALDKGVGILPKEIHDVVGPYLAELNNKLENGQQGTDPSETLPWDPTRIGGGILQNGLSENLQNAMETLPLNELPSDFGDGFGQPTGIPNNMFEQQQNGQQQPGFFPPNSYPNGGFGTNGGTGVNGTGLRTSPQAAQRPQSFQR